MQVKCNYQLSFYQIDGNKLFVFCSYELSRWTLIDKLYHIQDRPHDQMSIFQSERWHKIDSSWEVEDHARVANFCTENGKMHFI